MHQCCMTSQRWENIFWVECLLLSLIALASCFFPRGACTPTLFLWPLGENVMVMVCVFFLVYNVLRAFIRLCCFDTQAHTHWYSHGHSHSHVHTRFYVRTHCHAQSHSLTHASSYTHSHSHSRSQSLTQALTLTRLLSLAHTQPTDSLAIHLQTWFHAEKDRVEAGIGIL